MEKLTYKYNNLIRVLTTLENSIVRYAQAKQDKHIDKVTEEERRDSMIKRFELTYDLFWKYLREYIKVVHGAQFDSPRQVFRQALEFNIVTSDQEKQLLSMIESRNLTTHVYNVELANEVAAVIPSHIKLLHELTIKINPQTLTK